MSSGGPADHAANDGDASKPLSFMASAVRSFGGKKLSSSNTPSFRIGGVCTCATSVGRSRLLPAIHDVSIRLARRMCSRLESGSASMPTSPSSPEAYPSISSRIVSTSAVSAGACSDPTMFSGTPAVEPGV